MKLTVFTLINDFQKRNFNDSPIEATKFSSDSSYKKKRVAAIGNDELSED